MSVHVYVQWNPTLRTTEVQVPRLAVAACVNGRRNRHVALSSKDEFSVRIKRNRDIYLESSLYLSEGTNN